MSANDVQGQGGKKGVVSGGKPSGAKAGAKLAKKEKIKAAAEPKDLTGKKGEKTPEQLQIEASASTAPRLCMLLARAGLIARRCRRGRLPALVAHVDNSPMPPATAAAHDFGRTCCCLVPVDPNFRPECLGFRI